MSRRMNWNARAIYMMVAIFIVAIMMVTMVVPVLAQQGPQIQVTDSETRADQPDVAVDSQGNVHIAFSNAARGSYYQTFGTSPNRYTVIQWDAGHYDGDGLGKFQAILYENGNIGVNIADSSGADISITGVNQGDGSHGVDIGGTPASGTSYGFTWNGGTADYDDSAIMYAWIDVSSGNLVGNSEDDSSAAVPVGFDFTFYGNSYDTVYVSSNGYMSFTIIDPTSTGGPASFPSALANTAYVIAPLWDDWDPSAREIWYTMLDNDGNTLIDDTRITEHDGYESTRPAIVVDSQDKVHIIWRDQRWDDGGSQEVTYTKLDPSLAPQTGGPVDPAVITVVDDTRLTDIGNWYIYGPRMAVDSDDDIHIVWDDDDDDYIYYMKIDDDGNELVAETVIRSASQWRALPDIAVDSGDNLHVTWADYGDTSYDEIYYMMLDNTGNTMIDATLLTDDDYYYSKWTSIVVDYEDKVHIVFQDQRGDDHEIYYTKLDPSLDDQDTGPANAATITVIDDTALTPDDDEKSRHPAVAIGCGRYIHITWEESVGPDIHYILLDNNGNVLVSETALTTGGSASPSTYWTMPYLDVDANGKAHITWCDDRTGDYEVWYTSYQGPPCAAPPVGGEAYLIDKGGVLLPWIALLAAVAAGTSLLLVRRRRAQS